ncbi:hypothetical protein KY309_02900 [Candidatus Woesearchaeota archaeon]|nr:hypothetical protein [Candidatus Woesearchaeota archaeon]
MNDWQLRFKEWYEQNYGSKTKAEFSRNSQIPKSTWTAYLKHPVDLSKVSKKVKVRLHELTGLDCFKVDEQVETGDLVQQAVSSFYSLAGRLEELKVSPELREQLAGRIPKMDVGRVTALLHAMYKSRGDFEQWSLISGYEYQGGRK